MLAHSPSPTHRNDGKVPLLIPHSYPPPENKGTSFTLGLFLHTYKAPTPFGPYILCPDIDTKCRLRSYTLIGIFPKA